MAEQGRIVTPTAGTTCTRGHPTSNSRPKLLNASQGEMGFLSHLGRPSDSGFTSNQRPAIYYKPDMDLIDNPQMGLLLSDSFSSQTKRHYQKPHFPDGSGLLPNLINKPGDYSGFHQRKSHLRPGAAGAKTEYQQSFVPHCLVPAVPQRQVIMAVKGNTGFTEAQARQNFTFLEKKSGMVEPRQTHISVMKNDFLPPSLLKGTESIPGVLGLSCRESGYTRGDVAPPARPSSLLPSPQPASCGLTVNVNGKKELTGFLRNTPTNEAFPRAPFDPSDFITHYKSNFCNPQRLKCDGTGAGILTSTMNNSYSRRGMDRFMLRE